MSSPKIKPSILSKEDREQLTSHISDNTERIQEIAKLASRILNKGHTQPAQISFSFLGGETKKSTGPTPAAGEGEGYIICCQFPDGTCGCIADPPGISFPC